MSLRLGPLPLGANRFQLMRYIVDERFIYDEQFREDRLTGFSALKWRSKQRGDKKGTGSHTVRSFTDSPFVRCFEERGYGSSLTTLVE